MESFLLTYWLLTSIAKAIDDAVNIAAQPPLPGAAAHSSLVSSEQW